MAAPRRRARLLRRCRNHSETRGADLELRRREVAQRNQGRAWCAGCPSSYLPLRRSENTRGQNDSADESHRWRILARSQALCQRDPLSQKALHLVRACVGMLMADSLTGDLARKLMKIERQL